MLLFQPLGCPAGEIGKRGLVSGVHFAIEAGQIRVGADCFLHRASGLLTVEARQQIVRIDRVAPVAFHAHRCKVLGGLVELRIDTQRRFIIGNRAVQVAFIAIGGAAIVIGEVKTRIERDGAVIIGDGAVVIAFVIVGIATIGEKIGLRLEPDCFVIVGDRPVIIAERGI